MKYELIFLPQARTDAEEVRKYLSQYYAGTAGRFFALLKKRISTLKTNPFICEQYHERPSYRKMVVNDYLVFYKVNDDQKRVEIHRILHGSRDIDRFLK